MWWRTTLTPWTLGTEAPPTGSDHSRRLVPGTDTMPQLTRPWGPPAVGPQDAFHSLSRQSGCGGSTRLWTDRGGLAAGDHPFVRKGSLSLLFCIYTQMICI